MDLCSYNASEYVPDAIRFCLVKEKTNCHLEPNDKRKLFEHFVDDFEYFESCITRLICYKPWSDLFNNLYTTKIQFLRRLWKTFCYYLIWLNVWISYDSSWCFWRSTHHGLGLRMVHHDFQCFLPKWKNHHISHVSSSKRKRKIEIQSCRKENKEHFLHHRIYYNFICVIWLIYSDILRTTRPQ
jgi:hypothetical protein